MLQESVIVGGCHIRQLGPFISARTAARQGTPSDSACAAPFQSARAVLFKAAKAIIQIAEPRMKILVERDFISVAPIFFMRATR
jgi:hypothetical protein